MENSWDGAATPTGNTAAGNSTSSGWDGFATPVNPPASQINEADLPWYHRAASFVVHQTGLLANSAVKGATAIPTMLANAPIAIYNGLTDINNISGRNEKKIPYVNPYGEGADIIFGPNGQPRNGFERVESAVTSGLGGAGAGINIGKAALAEGSNFIGPKLADLFATRPAVQLEGAAGGSAADQLAKEGGYGPKTQIAASLIGGLAIPTAATGISRTASALQPLYNSGRQQIAANFLRGAATDPEAAIRAIKNAPEYIPGSIPTAGVASGDYGLMDVERTLRQQPGNPFSQRIVEQNAARNATMNAVAGTPGDIAQAQAQRAATTGPLYEAAQNVPVAPDILTPIFTRIDQAVQDAGAQSDLGKTLIAYKAKLQKSLPSMTPVDTGLVGEDGMPITRPNFEQVTQGPLTQIYKEERDQLTKSGASPGAYGAAVKGVVKPINYQLGKVLESQSPDLQYANQEYQRMSNDINRMQNMQDLTKSLTNTAQDAAGNYFYSPAKVANLIKAGGTQTENQGFQTLDKALDPNQQHYVQNLQSDLARDNMLNSPAVRPAGSPTFSYMSGTGDINSKVGSMLESVPIIGRWYKAQSQEIKQKVIDAYLDPEKAMQMLSQGKTPINETLKQAIIRSATAGTAASQVYGKTPH